MFDLTKKQWLGLLYIPLIGIALWTIAFYSHSLGLVEKPIVATDDVMSWVSSGFIFVIITYAKYASYNKGYKDGKGGLAHDGLI